MNKISRKGKVIVAKGKAIGEKKKKKKTKETGEDKR